MSRFSRWALSLLVFGVSNGAAVGQPTGHSVGPLPESGSKANPADAGPPPLADPLKQQAVTDAPPSLATPAVQFIMQASMDGLADLRLSELALRQSNSAGIRRFARRVISEQGPLNMRLNALAAAEGTSVPGVLDSAHLNSVQTLSAAAGRAFDTAYAAQMRSDHDRAVTLYSSALTLSDTKASQCAAYALPMLKARRRLALAL